MIWRAVSKWGPALLVVTLLTATATADPFHKWTPQLGQLKPSVEAETTYFPKQSWHGRDYEMGWVDFAAKGFIPVMQNEEMEISVQPHFSWRDIQGGAWLEQANASFPSDLYEIGVGTTMRMKLCNDWIVGGYLDLYSPSDKPFASMEEMAFDTTLFLQMPVREGLDLIAMVNVSNDRNCARCIPLPGGAVHYYPNKELDLFLGFPFTTVRWEPVDKLTLSGRMMAFREVSAKISYEICEPISVYTSFEWGSDSWFRHDRHSEANRLTYFDKRLAAGVKWNINDCLWVDASAGWAWDRFWYEGEHYSDRDENRIKLEDGCFGQLRVGMTF